MGFERAAELFRPPSYPPLTAEKNSSSLTNNRHSTFFHLIASLFEQDDQADASLRNSILHYAWPLLTRII